MLLSELGEKGLIERLRQRLEISAEQEAVVVGIGDDTAACRLAGWSKLLLFTCDMMVENTHFRRAWQAPEKLGWKALAVNISDIAAMGGKPLFAVISLALPKDLDIEFVDRLYEGLSKCAGTYGVILVGGDSVGSPQGVTIDVALVGEAEKVIQRKGAQPGDLLAVSGPVGRAALALQLLEKGLALDKKNESIAAALLEPKPRLKEGQALASVGVSAMMDLSDGLGEDLPRLCQASGVGAKLYADKIPLSGDFRAACEELKIDAVQLALQGGEDYELLFTAPKEQIPAVNEALAKIGAPPPAIIGEITAPEQGLQVVLPSGSATTLPKGFQHY
jgi:thiamine-monophosphate kinase